MPNGQILVSRILLVPICTVPILAASLLATASARAQTVAPRPDAELRAKALGEMRDAEKRPWVGVRVTMVSYPLPEAPSAGEVDVLHAVTDERGRFRASVLRNRRYSVWGTLGSRVSEVAEQVVAGVPVVVKEGRRVEPRRFRVTGLEAWKDHGPFRAQIVLTTKNPHAISFPLDENAEFVLPPLPGKKGKIFVLDKDGLPRQSREVSLPPNGSADETPIHVPSPERVYLAVRDIQSEKGLAGAAVGFVHRGDLVEVGETDAKGLLHVVLPAPSKNWYSELFAARKGYSVAPFQTKDAKQVKAGKWAPLKEGVEVARHTNLNKGLRFKGRILLGPGRPAAGMSLVVRGQGMHFSQIGSRSVSVYLRVFHTDADGRFEITGCLPEDYWRAEVFAVLAPRHVLQLPAGWRRHAHHVLMDFMELAKGKLDGVEDVGDIQLHEMCPVSVAVVDARGQPAPFATVSLMRGSPSNAGSTSIAPAVTDRMGRLLLLANPGEDNVILTQSGSSTSLFRLSVQSVPKDDSVANLKIRLPPSLTVSGHVVDAKGEAIPDLVLTIRATPNGRIAATPVGADVDANHREGRNSVYLQELDANTASRALSAAMGRGSSSMTDAKGAFRFEVPAFSMRYRIHGYHERKTLREEVSVVDESLSDLRLEFR